MKKKLLEMRETLWFTRVTPVIILILITVFFTIATKGSFGKLHNLKLIINQALVVGTVATGAVFIFGTGNVNLALGASTSLIATLATLIYLKTESVPLMIVSALTIAVVLMIVMTLLSTTFKVSVMFVSIVMMVMLSALQQTVLGAGTLTVPYKVTSALTKGNFTPIAFAIYFLVCFILFHLTKVGRAIRFIGTNETCSSLTGLYKKKYLLWAFIVTGVGVALASIMTIIRSGSISTNTASSLNMDVVLAIVLGGMSVFGGSRSFIYAGILGALTVTMLNNGLLMIGVSPTVLQLIRGIIFLTLVVAGQKRPDGLPTPEI